MIATAHKAGAARAADTAKAGRALRAVLRDGSDGERCLAARALGRIGDKRAVADLVAALRDPDPDLRGDAAEALRDLCDPRAAGRLLDNLIGDPDGTVKLAAIAALVKTDERRVIPWLRRMVRARDLEVAWDDAALHAGGWDDWLDIQVAAIAALAQLQAVEAVPDIIGALGDDDGQDLTETAVRALARLGADGAAALAGLLHDLSPRTRRRAAAALAGITGRDIAAPLAEALDDPAPEVRLAALRSRARVMPGDPLLPRMLFDPEPGVRSEALRLAPAPDRDMLVAMLDDPSGAVRVTALSRLGEVSGSVVDPALAERLGGLAEDSDGAVSGAAMATLVALDPGRARARLVALLGDSGRPAVTRLNALRALAGLGDATLLDTFAEAARAAPRQIRLAALAALAGIARRADDWPNPAGDTLTAALRGHLLRTPDDAAEPTEPVAESGAPAAAEEDPDAPRFPATTLDSILERNAADAPRTRRAAAAMAAPNDDLRVLAARVLGDIAHAGAAEALAAELGDANADLVLAAAGSLARIAATGMALPQGAVRALLAAAETAGPDKRCALIRALGPVSAASGVGALLQNGLGDADPTVRAAAAEALAAGGRGDLAAVRLDDPDEAVRLAAARAVAAVGDPACVPLLTETTLSGAGHLARPVARLLRDIDAPAATAALIAILADPSRRRDRGPAIEAIEELNRSHSAEAEAARSADHQL